LPVTHAHALHVAALPRHHGDPFDRLLIAQSQLEDVALVTADRHLDRYDVAIVPAT
jgi:PIN domain nuclease of toxin-antitoxin system